jgi:hypothetical protein
VAYDKPVGRVFWVPHWQKSEAEPGCLWSQYRSPIMASCRHTPDDKPPFWCEPPHSLSQGESTAFRPVHGEGRRGGCTQDALSRRVQIERAVQRQKFGHHRRGRALFVIFCCDMLPDASAHVESCREGCCRQFQIAGRQLEDAATARSQRGDDDRLCGPLPSRLHHAQPGVMKATRISEQHRHCLRERAPRPRPGTCQIRGDDCGVIDGGWLDLFA